MEVTAVVGEHGEITLRDLPFSQGEEIVVRVEPKPSAEARRTLTKEERLRLFREHTEAVREPSPGRSRMTIRDASRSAIYEVP